MIATTAPICDVTRVLADARAALGGVPGARFAQATATGSVVTSGLKGTARFDLDLRGGRYAYRFDVAVMGSNAEVYNGTTVWAMDISGGVHPYDTWFPQARARTDAFIISGAYLDPHSGAAYRCLGTHKQDGVDVVTIQVQPHAGIPAELAFDAHSHLLASVTERFPITTLVRRYADYRTVDGTVLPFLIEQGTLQEPDDGFVFDVREYKLSTNSTAVDFARPQPTASAVMIGNSSSATIPLQLEGRELLVWASIDGHKPMPFILDTGGHAILTTGAAKTLGLHMGGAGESGGAGAGTIALQYTRVRSIRLGNAELLDQPMLVIPYPYEFYERGGRQPIAGILGLEVFERFATRIDYGNRTVTLAPLSTFVYHGGGTPVPFRFQDDMPMIDAQADGHTGMFGTDTGNSGSLILFGDFLKRTGLDDAYSGGVLLIGHGTGGRNTGRLATLHTFTVGGHTIRNIASDFTNMQKGAFSSWTEAGNVGYEILSRFIPTYDYARETLYLAPCTQNCVPPRNHIGFAFEKDDPASFLVIAVSKTSAAARAGITVGDRIVAVDGKPVTTISAGDLFLLLTQPGTALQLTLQHGSSHGVRTVTLHT